MKIDDETVVWGEVIDPRPITPTSWSNKTTINRCLRCYSTLTQVQSNVDTGRKFCKRCSLKRLQAAQRHFASDGKISKVVGKHLLRVSPD